LCCPLPQAVYKKYLFKEFIVDLRENNSY